MEIGDIHFIDEQETNGDKLIICHSPLYIENDPSLPLLLASKFLAQQRFELEKSILAQSAQEVTDLEDLFEGSLILDEREKEKENN